MLFKKFGKGDFEYHGEDIMSNMDVEKALYWIFERKTLQHITDLYAAALEEDKNPLSKEAINFVRKLAFWKIKQLETINVSSKELTEFVALFKSSTNTKYLVQYWADFYEGTRGASISVGLSTSEMKAHNLMRSYHSFVNEFTELKMAGKSSLVA